MKQNFLFFILVCLSFVSCSNREDEIKAVVNKWNDLHNTHNAIEFKELYTPSVLFYGRQTSMETCYARKKAFLTSEFQQDIISPIAISYYSSGIIKCDFTKRTRYRKEKVREYYCYLLIKKETGKYLIAGESDLLSDQRRNTQLDIGNKITKPANRAAIYITIILLLLIAFIIYWIRKKKERQATEWELFKEQYRAPAEPENITVSLPVADTHHDEDLISKVKAAVMEEMKSHITEDSPGQKGYLFETFVVERFDKAYFKLIEWRSDKFHQGIYAASSKLPDLEYHFKTTRHDCKIAIECKWRANFNRKVEVAKEESLRNYWQYSVDNQIQVFIILGVGGTPENPEDLYILPLDEIPGPILYQRHASLYKRYREKGDFFFNADKMTLE